MSFPYFSSVEPVDSIFKQTGPDEDQKLEGSPNFTVLMKGYKTRSCIYERILPDDVGGALRIQGPRGSNTAMIFDNLGTIKIKTGLKTAQAGSGIFGLKTYGQQQLHNGRSNLQYNTGGKEDEGEALNILCYGDVVEEVIGATKYVRAMKILIEATDSMIIRGQNINIESSGELNMVGRQITQIQVNRKDIVIGQDMNFGSGEKTTMQFDPRAQVNVISTGSINHKVLQDYKLTALGCVSLFGVGGPGVLVKNRTVGMATTTKTKFAAGGNLGAELISSLKTKVEGLVKVEIGSNASVDVVADAGEVNIGSGAGGTYIDSLADVTIDANKVEIDGTAEVRIQSQGLIYLN